MSEYTEIEKPFLDSLTAVGWEVIDQGPGIPANPAPSQRRNFRQWLLPEVFARAVAALNPGPDGQTWLTAKQIEDLHDQILRQPNRTLLEANEAVQKLLFKAQVDVNETTGEEDPVVTLIDFHHPERNHFLAINQFRVDTPGCVRDFIIPDIVLFINGIPIGVVEGKKSGPNQANPMAEAFVQLQRYMNRREETRKHGLREGEPRLFHSNLLLIRSTGIEANYGTITSGEEHFYPWKTLWPDESGDLKALSPQDQLIHGMLPPANLLSMLRCCSVFMDTDAGPRVKVLCRYQQFRAAHRLIERLRSGKTPEERGGVVWHTQGSGKSLTMVFAARMLRASPDLCDYKVVLVNDRVDLEKQLAATATLIGGRVRVIESEKALREDLATDASDINMVMVHKFQRREETSLLRVVETPARYGAIPSGSTFGVVNESARIVLMIDEAHRTQSSDLGDNLFEAFPNAARIAFTGTPLITERHAGRRTVKRFGEYIDTYKLMDAVADGTTLQILYEGRTADAAIYDKHGFETKFENLFVERSEAELLAIKKKYGATGDILEAEKRIAAIAGDLVKHYLTHIYPNGFKAQVVCHSKLAAVRYQQAIHQALADYAETLEHSATPDAARAAEIRKLKAAVVISSDGTNEPAYVTTARRQAREWNAVKNFCATFALDDPEKPHGGIAFLVVCDMLLTGFDAPVEQVMYLDKRLREHTLLQAIARTNRVKKGKQRGYIVDYIGLTANLTEALKIYAADEIEELTGLKSIQSELPVLEERYQRLLQLFTAHQIHSIQDFVEGRLQDKAADEAVANRAVDLLEDERIRADFGVFLKKFLSSLDIILPHSGGHPYRVPARRFGYLIQTARQRYKDETFHFGDAGKKVRDLINEHLISLGINPKVPPVELLAEDFIDQLNSHAGGNARAKASEMEHAIRKHCTVHHDEDPAFYKNLSEKVERLIVEYRDKWEELAKEFEKIRNEALAGRREGRDGMSREASAFYEHIAATSYGDAVVPEEDQSAMRTLMEGIVNALRQDIGSIDYWRNSDKQKRTRAEIKQAIALSGIEALKARRERVAVEILSLAKNRHHELLQGGES